jgi:hypothetical protein
MINNTLIDNLWDWFEENDELNRRIIYTGDKEKLKELKNAIDEKILVFGHFTWEINAGKSKEYQFVISPNREFELLQLSKKIIAEAPDLDNWEFLYAKEKVAVIEPFKIFDESLDSHLVNVANWKYKLGGETVYVFAPSLKNIDSETEQHALDLVATALLGEEYRILDIKTLVKVEEFDDSFIAI